MAASEMLTGDSFSIAEEDFHDLMRGLGTPG
jgi:hypothetical protein